MYDFDSNQYEKAAERIIRRSFRGGKSLLAFCFDAVFFGLLCLFALYIAVRPHFLSASAARLVSVLIFAAGAALASAIRERRYMRFRSRLIGEAAALAARNKLMKDPDEVLDRAERVGSAAVFRGTDSVTADDIRRIIKNKSLPLKIVTFAEPTKKAAELLRLFDGVMLTDPFTALGEDPVKLTTVSAAEIGAALRSKYGAQTKKPSFSLAMFALTKERALKYAALGGGLMLLSPFTGYALYYRVIASVAISLGAAVFLYEAAVKRIKGASA